MSDTFIYAADPTGKLKWEFIPNTPEARTDAINRGFTAFSTYSFESEPPKSNPRGQIPEPMRYGDLWMDFDDKQNPANAIMQARDLLLQFIYKAGLDLSMLKIYMSGSKGCHICIPAVIFGGENGDPYLPEIHKQFVRNLIYFFLRIHIRADWRNCTIIDKHLYQMGKGQPLRESNVQRPDGRYKVEVSVNEFMEMDILELLDLPKENRMSEIQHSQPYKNSRLSQVYKKAVYYRNLLKANPWEHSALENCTFFTHCIFDYKDLEEECWFAFLGILKSLRNDGINYAQIFSEGHPEYTEEDTYKKFIHASKYPFPTCESLRKFGYCSDECKMTSLCKRRDNINKIPSINNNSFILRDDGLYFCQEGDDEQDAIKISSPLKILGKVKNPDNSGWSRLLEVTTPDNCKVQILIPMEDCVGKGELAIKYLARYGLETYTKDSVKLIMAYIRNTNGMDIYVRTTKTGWHSNVYILPDAQFGYPEMGRKYIFGGSDGLLTVSGTLEDWYENIGKYCRGNSLAMLLVLYALTGPVLQLCNIEGGGLHIYGSSSSGKSTLALVAGSVCGGDRRTGFLRQWRTTDNAAEKIAVLHNDNLLVMDEISQAKGDSVYHMAYMLPNGQGKARMDNRTIALREPDCWTLSLLSTGEQALPEKIEENKKNTSMAGQETRILDLPVDKGNGSNIFPELHGFASPAELSEHLKKYSKLYWGSLLRAFLAKLCGENEDEFRTNIESIQRSIMYFTQKMDIDNASGQVKRAALKFGVTFAVGKFLSETGLISWTIDECFDACKEWFCIWINNRGGSGNLEIEKAISRLLEVIERDGIRLFADLDDQPQYLPTGHLGYKKIRNDKVYYYFSKPAFSDIVGKPYIIPVKNKLQKLGILDYDFSSKTYEKTIHPKGISMRAIGIIIQNEGSDKQSKSDNNKNMDEVADTVF